LNCGGRGVVCSFGGWEASRGPSGRGGEVTPPVAWNWNLPKNEKLAPSSGEQWTLGKVSRGREARNVSLIKKRRGETRERGLCQFLSIWEKRREKSKEKKAAVRHIRKGREGTSSFRSGRKREALEKENR